MTNQNESKLRERVAYLESELCQVQSWLELQKEITKLLDGNSEFENVYHLSPAFWTVTLQCLAAQSIVQLARVYDEQKDSYGLKKLIEQVENDSTVFYDKNGLRQEPNGKDAEKTVAITQMQGLYNEVESARSILKGHRDKQYSHTAPAYIGKIDTLYEKYNLTWDVMEQLVSVAHDIVDIAETNGLNLGRKCSVPVNMDDVYKLIYCAHKGAIKKS